MSLQINLTKIPPLDSVVIKQEGGHLFIAAPNSIVIDRTGLLGLIEALLDIGFISKDELLGLKGAKDAN